MWILLPFQVLVMTLGTCAAALWIPFWTTLQRPERAYRIVYWWSRLLHLVTLTHYEVRGVENVPDGPYLIISSHSSHLDGPGLIVTLPHPIYFVIKKELAQIPIWGWAARSIGFVVIDRARSAEARKRLRKALALIREGRRVLVFPEGTRSPDHRLHRFKKGGFHLAIDADVPILPVAINGSRRLLPKGSIVARPGTVTVIVGKPIPTDGLTKDDLPELMEQTRNAILEGRRLDPDFIDD